MLLNNCQYVRDPLFPEACLETLNQLNFRPASYFSLVACTIFSLRYRLGCIINMPLTEQVLLLYYQAPSKPCPMSN
jgi:hypothetical protein